MQDQFKFSAWAKYSDYKKLKDCPLPGLYLLAHFDGKPGTGPVVTSKQIVYIGETTSQTIGKRLYQFGRSAFKQLPAHSGGWSYSREFLNSTKVDLPPDNLYVSVMGVEPMSKDGEKVYIKYLERAALWLYFKKHKSLPRCNAA